MIVSGRSVQVFLPRSTTNSYDHVETISYMYHNHTVSRPTAKVMSGLSGILTTLFHDQQLRSYYTVFLITGFPDYFSDLNQISPTRICYYACNFLVSGVQTISIHYFLITNSMIMKSKHEETALAVILDMSRVMWKPTMWVSEQVRHKSSCTSQRSCLLNLGSRGIVLFM